MDTEIRQGRTESNLQNFLKDVKRELTLCCQGRAHHGLAQMAEYHFSSFGKLIRPHVIYELGQIYRLPWSQLLAWGVCCEILHNATLIHDDIQDGDEVRRGRPTIWKKFGRNQAINLGDFLIFVAPTSIYTSSMSSSKKLELLDVLLDMSARLVDGQNLEFELSQAQCAADLKDKYSFCVKNKTAALFSGMAKGVGVLAELESQDHENLVQLFEAIGVLFQMQDDLLDLYGDKQRGEKGCDIKEGKISFLLVHLFHHSPQHYKKACEILNKSRCQTESRDISLIKQWIEESGALESALRELQEHWEALTYNSAYRRNAELRVFVQRLIAKILVPIDDLIQLPGNEEQR